MAPDPASLIDVARLLIDDKIGQPTEEQLRRAVSTVYYAMFHKIAGAAALRFMGPGAEDNPGYALLYRSFDHKHLKDMCEKLARTSLSEAFRRHLRREAVSQDMRDFAAALPALQKARHEADYDPTASFDLAGVRTRISLAELAMSAFDRVDPDERADILALLMLKPRA